MCAHPLEALATRSPFAAASARRTPFLIPDRPVHSIAHRPAFARRI